MTYRFDAISDAKGTPNKFLHVGTAINQACVTSGGAGPAPAPTPTPTTPPPTPAPVWAPGTCNDDNSAEAWLGSYSCEQLKSFGWCKINEENVT